MLKPRFGRDLFGVHTSPPPIAIRTPLSLSIPLPHRFNRDQATPPPKVTSDGLRGAHHWKIGRGRRPFCKGEKGHTKWRRKFPLTPGPLFHCVGAVQRVPHIPAVHHRSIAGSTSSPSPPHSRCPTKGSPRCQCEQSFGAQKKGLRVFRCGQVGELCVFLVSMQTILGASANHQI